MAEVTIDAPTPSAPPRVWATLFVFLWTMSVALAASLLVEVVLSATFPDPSLSGHPLRMMANMAPMEAVLLIGAIRSARKQGGGVRSRLGLVRPRLRPGTWAVLIVGSGVPFFLAILLASALPTPAGGEETAQAWQSMSPALALLWVLFVGLVPGFSEEIFFRGLIQRRMIAVWRPSLAIGMSSVLFAIVHFSPAVVSLALVLGIWLGIIAWRTGSTLPGIAIHALVNSLWNASQIAFRQLEPDVRVMLPILIVLGINSLVCFIGAVIFLWRHRAITGMAEAEPAELCHFEAGKMPAPP